MSPSPSSSSWWIRLVAGLALCALGIVLLANPRAAATTLAVLVGLALVVHGLDELLVGEGRRGLDVAGGLASIGAGIVAMVWPDATLWVLAVIAGMACVAVGSLQITTGMLSQGQPGWGWTLARGVASAVVGVLALTWPEATAFVLAVLLGLRTVGLGGAEILLAVEGRRTAVLT